MTTETVFIVHDPIYDNPLKFLRALAIVEKIAPYKHLKDAMVEAVEIMPFLEEMPEDLTRSEAALIVLRAKLNSDTEPETEDDTPETKDVPYEDYSSMTYEDLSDDEPPVGNDDSPADDIPNRF